MISIIITNFNKGKYLLNTLESCKNQKDNNFEIILFDDKSTDNSLEITKIFFLKNKKIRFKIIKRYSKKSLKKSVNQLTAIKISLNFCKGQFISLLDGDDLFSKEKIYFLNKIIKKKKYKIIYNSYKIIENKEIFINKRHFKKRFILYPVFPPTSCCTIEKKFLKKIIKKIDTRSFFNCFIDFRIASYATKYYLDQILYTKKILTTYVINSDGIDSVYKNIFSYLFWKRKIESIILHTILKK